MPSAETTSARSGLVGPPLLRIVASMPERPASIHGARPTGEPVVVVRLVGELDVSNATIVGDQLEDLLSYRPGADVVLDLSGVSFVDVPGMRVLVEVRRVLTVRRRHLFIRGVRPTLEMLMRVFEGEDPLHTVHPRSDAVRD